MIFNGLALLIIHIITRIMYTAMKRLLLRQGIYYIPRNSKLQVRFSIDKKAYVVNDKYIASMEGVKIYVLQKLWEFGSGWGCFL